MEAPETRGSDTKPDVQSAIQCLGRLLLLRPLAESSELMGVRSRQKDYQGLRCEKLLVELISVATRKDWKPFEVVDPWRAWGVYSVFILRDVVSDKLLRRDCYFWGAFLRLFCRKA